MQGGGEVGQALQELSDVLLWLRIGADWSEAAELDLGALLVFPKLGDPLADEFRLGVLLPEVVDPQFFRGSFRAPAFALQEDDVGLDALRVEPVDFENSTLGDTGPPGRTPTITVYYPNRRYRGLPNPVYQNGGVPLCLPDHDVRWRLVRPASDDGRRPRARRTPAPARSYW